MIKIFELYSTKIYRNIFLALFVIVALVPLSFFRDVRFSFLGITRIPYQLIFTLFVLLLLAISWSKSKNILFPEKKVWGILILSLLPGVIFSTNFKFSFFIFLSFVIRGLLVPISIHGQWSKLTHRRLLTGFSIIATFAGFFGLIEYIGGYNFPYHKLFQVYNSYYEMTYSHRGGLVGPLGHPVIFANFLALFVPIVPFTLLKPRWKIFCITILVWAIILSQSRSGVLSVVLSGGFIIYFKFLYEKKNPWRWVFPVIFAVIVFLGVITIRNVVGGNFNLKLSGETHRISSYFAVWKITKDFPFFGLGLGQFPNYYNVYRYANMVDTISSPDNQYLRLWSEVGTVGMAFYLYFVWVVIRRFWNQIDLFKSHPMAIGLWGSYFSGSICLFFYDGFYWLPIQFSYWIILAFALSQKFKYRDSKPV